MEFFDRKTIDYDTFFKELNDDDKNLFEMISSIFFLIYTDGSDEFSQEDVDCLLQKIFYFLKEYTVDEKILKNYFYLFLEYYANTATSIRIPESEWPQVLANQRSPFLFFVALCGNQVRLKNLKI